MGEGGAPMRLLLGCGKTLRGGGERGVEGISLDLSNLRWEMGIRSGFDIICGVGTRL